MSDLKFNYPFSSNDDQPICDENICPVTSASGSPSPSPSTQCNSGSLANPNVSCKPCEEEDNTQDTNYFAGKFLGCDVIGFSARLGFNNSESVLSIDLGTSGSKTNANQQCEQFTDDYGIVHNCFDPNTCVSTDPNSGVCCEGTNCTTGYADQTECENAGGTWIVGKTCDDNPCETVEYTGRLGHVYTFRVGKFCFRGILTDHQYVENDNGFRYKVNLSDGRQVLSNVVVLMDQYVRIPDKLKPNTINVLYELEETVGDNICGSSRRCQDFGKAGNIGEGMYLKKVLEGIDGKPIQLPKTAACLTLNVSKVINIVSCDLRVASSDSTVLDIVNLACEESGYDFYVAIVGWEMVIFPINNKYQTAGVFNDEAPLFKFLSNISENSLVLDKEYGQELTFNRSKRIVVGDNIRYLTIVEPGGDPCVISDPGSIAGNIGIDASSNELECVQFQLPDCSG